MKWLNSIARWFKLGDASKPVARALLLEQFRILTNHVPILYAVTTVDMVSIAYVSPPSVPSWLRFGVPCVLVLASAVRVVHWLMLRTVAPTAEETLKYLSRGRMMGAAMNAGFSLGALVLFDHVGPSLRAPIALLVFMGAIGGPTALPAFQALRG